MTSGRSERPCSQPSGPDRTVPSGGRFLLRCASASPVGHLEVSQDGEPLARQRARLAPGRSIRLDADWLDRVNPAGGPITVTAR